MDSEGGKTGAAGVPAGWYGDPAGHLRWWDGRAWGPAAPAPNPTLPSTTPAALAHLGCVLGGVVPLVVYLTANKADRFTRTHAAEALNMQLTLLCVWVPVVILASVLIVVTHSPVGFLALWLLAVAGFVLNLVWGIRAAGRARRWQPWRYPVRIGFVRG